MRQAAAVTEFDDFVRQQAQGPARPAWWWRTTGQGRDPGPLFAVNADRTARARLFVQDLQAGLEIAIPPAGHALPTHLQRLGDLQQGVTGLQLQQSRSPLEGAGFGAAPAR